MPYSPAATSNPETWVIACHMLKYLTAADIKKCVESFKGATVPYDPNSLTAWNGADLAARDIIYFCPECYTYGEAYACPCLTEGSSVIWILSQPPEP